MRKLARGKTDAGLAANTLGCLVAQTAQPDIDSEQAVCLDGSREYSSSVGYGSEQSPWQELPEGLLLRILEALDLEDGGRVHVRGEWKDLLFPLQFYALVSKALLQQVRKAGVVCRQWRRAALEILLGDTAASRPDRRCPQLSSVKEGPRKTATTCAAVVWEPSEPASDGCEACSKQRKQAAAATMVNQRAVDIAKPTIATPHQEQQAERSMSPRQQLQGRSVPVRNRTFSAQAIAALPKDKPSASSQSKVTTELQHQQGTRPAVIAPSGDPGLGRQEMVQCATTASQGAIVGGGDGVAGATGVRQPSACVASFSQMWSTFFQRF